MNKIYAIVGFAFLAVMLPAQAQYNHRPNAQHIQQHHHYHYPARPVRPAPQRHYHNNRGDWVVPAIIGGVGTAIIIDHMNRPREVVVTPPPPIVECTEWREMRTSDGRIYTERTCTELP